MIKNSFSQDFHFYIAGANLYISKILSVNNKIKSISFLTSPQSFLVHIHFLKSNEIDF